jgi:murein DD-endopeptidase MepM/ murein hydrolase activator NlpD
MSTHTLSRELETALQRAALASRHPRLLDENRPWVWPLPDLNGRAPTILGPTVTRDCERDSAEEYPRMLLAYDRAGFIDHAFAFFACTRSASLHHALPSRTPVFAAQDGEVVAAEKSDDGYTVLVEHANGWATCYRNVRRIFCRPRKLMEGGFPERVRGGDVLGHVGGSSRDIGVMKPFRFELWRRESANDGGRYRAVDPASWMGSWVRLSHIDKRLPGAADVRHAVKGA